jgi:hypothetical protein
MTKRLILWLCCAVFTVAGLAVTGCKSTPQRILYNTESATQISVEAAMLAWADYVAQFQPGPAIEQQVKDAYDAYQLAMVAAVDASEVYAAAAAAGNDTAAQRAAAEVARQAAAGNLADLINLIRHFGGNL